MRRGISRWHVTYRAHGGCERLADGLHVAPVCVRGAERAIRVRLAAELVERIPRARVQADDFEAALLEQERRDRGVNAAGHRDDRELATSVGEATNGAPRQTRQEGARQHVIQGQEAERRGRRHLYG